MSGWHIVVIGMVYALQTHVEFTFNNQIIPHTCITILVSNDD